MKNPNDAIGNRTCDLVAQCLKQLCHSMSSLKHAITSRTQQNLYSHVVSRPKGDSTTGNISRMSQFPGIKLKFYTMW